MTELPKMYNVSNFMNGWLVGDFQPALLRTAEIEVAIKTYAAAEREASHYQLKAHEATLVISGECMLAGHHLVAGDILVIPPLFAGDFEALEDCTVLAIKWPSLPEDKVLA
jgi:uncharacterized ubiquitin-like protein YukD